MKKLLGLFCMVVVLGLVSSSFALDPMLIGDFEDGEVGSEPGRYDYWYGDGTVVDDVTVPAVTTTRGTHSLKCTSDLGGWGPGIAYPINELANKFDVFALAADDGAVLGFDVTFETVPGGWAEIGYSTNNGAPVGPSWDKAGWVAVPAEYFDGAPHPWAIPLAPLQASLQSALDTSYEGYYNIGIVLNTGEGPLTMYIDNIWIYPDGVIDTYGPYGPSIVQDFNVDTDYVDLTLNWKAGKDPGGRLPDPNIVYTVNPDIVDEYVFMSTLNVADANLYYVGATGIDPGIDDPNSEYGTMVLPINSSYYWTVVEAMDGYAHNGADNALLTVGVSTLDDVDPNNIIGPVWTFATLSTIPVIDTQPVNTRFGIDDANAQFTIAVTSNTTPQYQWFYSLDGEINDPGDNPISGLGADTDTLTITTHNKAYQAYYYCRVANASTVSGGLGGTEPDVYSDVVSLVVERQVAEYLFDGDATDSSGSGYNGTEVGSPSYVAGVDGGSALSLDGATQYVDLGDGDPNNNNKAFPRADLLEAGGVGGGLDVGSVMCWVKLDTAPATEAPILSNTNAGWPTTSFQFAIATDGVNTNIQSFIWGDADNGAVFWQSWRPGWVDPFNIAGDGNWHMMAVTWDMAGIMQTYVDGSLIATTGTGVANTFSAWTDNSMLIGASHDGSYFDGLIDNLRVYNYEVAAEDIAQEYYDITGNPGCIYTGFAGSDFNADNTGTSYCKVDLADFAGFAASWLNDGFYPVP